MKNYQRQKIPGQRDALKQGVTEGMVVHSIVQWIWEQINSQEISQEDVAQRADVASSTLRKWRSGVRSPRLVELESVVNVLGYKLVVTLKEDKDSE